MPRKVNHFDRLLSFPENNHCTVSVRKKQDFQRTSCPVHVKFHLQHMAKLKGMKLNGKKEKEKKFTRQSIVAPCRAAPRRAVLEPFPFCLRENENAHRTSRNQQPPVHEISATEIEVSFLKERNSEFSDFRLKTFSSGDCQPVSRSILRRQKVNEHPILFIV